MKCFVIKVEKKKQWIFLWRFLLELYMQFMVLLITPSRYLNFYWQESPGFSLISPSIPFQPPSLSLQGEKKGLFLDAPHLSP